MSAGLIKRGDLVYVYRWLHEHGGGVGMHYIVEGFVEVVHCPVCKKWLYQSPALVGRGAIPVSWLKKVPPLPTDEQITTIEERPYPLVPEEVA